MKRLPIIYIRGYAGPTTGIDAQVDDPFYGFNRGATHVRVGGSGEPAFYQFEGPMLRLMVDHQYHLLVHGDQHAYLENSDDHSVAADSIWVYRFYDQAAARVRRTSPAARSWSESSPISGSTSPLTDSTSSPWRRACMT